MFTLNLSAGAIFLLGVGAGIGLAFIGVIIAAATLAKKK
jgi:hypothetical protein